MTRDEIGRFLQERQQYWAARDADGLASQHAVYGSVDSPMFGRVFGRQAIAESYHRLFTAFPDWITNFDEAIIEADRIAQPFSATATHIGEFMGLPGTKRRSLIHGVLLMHVADGLIQDERRIYDFSMMLMQVGVLRGKPGH
jgi:predicted ester cyclase